MRFATSEGGDKLEDIRVIPTPQDFNEALEAFGEYKRQDLKAVVGGIAGEFDKEKNVLVFSPNLKKWVNTPVRSRLESLFGTKVSIENDAALAALGESKRGAGKVFGIVAYLTIGTGIGGARCVDGEIDKNSCGFEPGHQIIGNGSFEQQTSGAAIERRYGKKPEDIIDDKIWEEIMERIAVGVNNTIVYWSPDVVILGGGVVQSVSFKIEKVNEYLRKIYIVNPNPPEVKRSLLGGEAGLYGSLEILKQKR